MSFVLAVISTVLSLITVLIILMVNKEDVTSAAYISVYDDIRKIEKLQNKDKLTKKKREGYSNFQRKMANLFVKENSDKEIKKISKHSAKLQNGNFNSISIFFLPGYALLRTVDYLRYNKLYLNAQNICTEIYGRKFGRQKADQLFARMLSTNLLSLTIVMIISTLLFLMGDMQKALMILVFGTALAAVLCYAFYDDATDNANKRRESIKRQVPQVLSKLALLVTSGMSLSQAWKETAYSQDLEIYIEMQKTCEELDNLVSSEVAFSNFAHRCNTKETSKLATSLIQSASKGNKELGALLKNMASESWLERKNLAKQDSEKANAKLLLPTLLLFLMIIIMIMIPITSSFNSI